MVLISPFVGLSLLVNYLNTRTWRAIFCLRASTSVSYRYTCNGDEWRCPFRITIHRLSKPKANRTFLLINVMKYYISLSPFKVLRPDRDNLSVSPVRFRTGRPRSRVWVVLGRRIQTNLDGSARQSCRSDTGGGHAWACESSHKGYKSFVSIGLQKLCFSTNLHM